MKKLLGISRNDQKHWVGDAFHVRTMLIYDTMGPQISPFLLLDHGGPTEFPPSEKPRGVGEHPHRGFETVTIVYSGEVEHGDSGGNRGRIGPGDVQWMTAASGVVHEEFQGREAARRGGTMEMAQLWVNLPAKDKMSPPRYQEITADRIPTLELGSGATARVIAGDLRGTQGPAHTFTRLNVWDVSLPKGARVELTMPDGFNTMVPLLHGAVKVNDERDARAGDLALFERHGDLIRLAATEDSKMLVLSGEPIDEPIAGAGPFVMNTQDEIRQALRDYQAGRMGHLPDRGR